MTRNIERNRKKRSSNKAISFRKAIRPTSEALGKPITMKDPNEWVARLETPGKSLLEPFTSEATRKAGGRLVLLSGLTILLSESIITIGEGTFIGLKVQPSRVADIVQLAGLACVYFLILYIFDIYRDWKATQYKRMPALVEYQRLKDEAINEYNVRTESLNNKTSEIARLLLMQADKMAEICKTNSDAEPPNFMLRDQYTDYCRNDELYDLQKKYIELQSDEYIYKRFDVLVQMMKATYRVDRLRLAIEVVFPVGLGLFAVTSIIRHLFH